MATKFKDLKAGEKLSETQYYSIVATGGTGKGAFVKLTTDDGQEVTFDKEYVEAYLISSAQFEKEETLSRTDAAALFIASSNVAITVNFNTQVKEKEAKEGMYALYPNKGGKIMSEADFKKAIDASVKGIINGEERTMIGRHYGSVNEFGRVNFVDMEIKPDTSKPHDVRLRQVDPRTINWMIIKGVKYKVKK